MGSLLFTQPNCLGEAYINVGNGLFFAGALTGPYIEEGRFWAVRREVETGVIPIESSSLPTNTVDPNPCVNQSSSVDERLPADEITEPLPFTIPFPLPLYVAPIAP